MATFSFGKNWQDFLLSLNDERYRTAEESLTKFLQLTSLRGMTFLDIGSGSGLFSYSAFKLGADVTSFDVDPFSVACTEYMHEQAGKPSNWKVRRGSILDTAYVDTLGTFDIVYAWGSLHHTGKMWQAIENAALRVKPGGLLMLALYNRVDGRWGSTFWLKMKRFYNRMPRPIQRVIATIYEAKLFVYFILKGRNPFVVIKNFKTKRGMSWHHDIVDWLGGFPYEAATVEEVFLFMKKTFPSFVLENIKTTNGLGNNQFLFRYPRGLNVR